MKRVSFFVTACLLLFAVVPVFPQSTNSGDIRGTVTDETGAVIPGATVTVLNINTQVSKNYTTDGQGVFDTSSIVTGSYKLTFTKEGFKTVVRGPITLQVGVTGVNAQMSIGSTTQQVVVTTDEPLLKTESGDQSMTLPSQTLALLPEVGQTWENEMYVVPGSVGLGSAYGQVNPAAKMAVNGNLPYSTVLLDGAQISMTHSNNFFLPPLETTQELTVATSSFSAQYGIGGAMFQEISKGGTSQFHGAAYDYFQNNALNAAPYGFGNQVAIPILRYHNFGGSIGGPILKKKMFFYFNYDRTISEHQAVATGADSTFFGTYTVPTQTVLGGDFSGQPLIYDPTTQTIATDAQGNQYPVRKSFMEEYGTNAIPAGMLDTVAKSLEQFYPTASNHVAGGRFVSGALNSIGVLQNNFYSNPSQNSPMIRYFGRLDYDVTPNNRITITDAQRDTPIVTPSAVFVCPIGCQAGDADSNSAQISDVWNISPTMINEARMAFAWQGNYYTDLALGKGYAAKLGWQFAKADDIPKVSYASYTNVAPQSNSYYQEQVFTPSDVVTMIRGKHILHFGGEFLIFRDDDTAWGNTNAGTLSFSGQYTQHWTVNPSTGVASADPSTGVGYADFLLGTSNGWNASVSPEFGARFKSPQVFVQDDYKMRPNLTINVGLRYQINHGWNEVNNNIRSFDPTVTNPATNTLGAMWYASTHANGRTSLQADVFSTFLPRLGFSYEPKPDMTIRGAFGIYSYNWNLDTYGGGMGSANSSSGNATDQTNGITPLVQLSGAGASLPFVHSPTTPNAYNGQGVTYNPYHTPVPQIYEWTVSVQKQVVTNLVAEVAYVASHGFNLSFPSDHNQIPATNLSASDLAFRPYPQYQGVNGDSKNAISNYNSLQASITERMKAGLTFNFNYVWSHMLDDQDSTGWGGSAGSTYYQNAYDPSANYSNSNFDVRHAFKGNAVYELPVGRGRLFLSNSNRLVDGIIGGWRLSTMITLTTGNPFTLTTNGNTYAHAGNQFPNRVLGVSTTPRGGRTIQEWYNPAAFSLPLNGTFGNVRRNCLYGPGFNLVNLSLGKQFTLIEQTHLEIRADANNAFNHPSFAFPQSSLSGAAQGQPFAENLFGGNQISGVYVGGRTMELSARFSF